MTNKVSTTGLLLDTLLENPNVKAALLLDDRGYIIEKRGSAQCIKGEQDDDITLITSKKAGLESLYLVQIKKDFLVVVFDERLNFERLKTGVDNTLTQFNLAPPPNEG